MVVVVVVLSTSVRPSSDTKTKLPLARDSLYFSKCKRERERGNACVACVVVTNWATRAPPPHQWNGGRRRSPWDRWPSSYRDAKRSLQPDVVVVGCCCVDRPIALSHLKFRCRSAIFLLLSSPPPLPFFFNSRLAATVCIESTTNIRFTKWFRCFSFKSVVTLN